MTQILIDRKDFDKKLKGALNGISIDFQEALKDKLTKSHGKDTGLLQSSVRGNVEKTTITMEMAEHGKYLEFGTPPHHPPVEELKGWARRKLGDENAAWALAKHIALYGTRPFPFIRTTIENKLTGIIKRNLKEAFRN